MKLWKTFSKKKQFLKHLKLTVIVKQWGKGTKYFILPLPSYIVAVLLSLLFNCFHLRCSYIEKAGSTCWVSSDRQVQMEARKTLSDEYLLCWFVHLVLISMYNVNGRYWSNTNLRYVNESDAERVSAGIFANFVSWPSNWWILLKCAQKQQPFK